MTDMTPLDLDAAIEAGAKAVRDVMRPGGGPDAPPVRRDQVEWETATAVLAAIGYPALVEEVEKSWQRGHDTARLVLLGEIEQLRAERDAAIARAEKAECDTEVKYLNAIGFKNQRDEALAKVAAVSALLPDCARYGVGDGPGACFRHRDRDDPCLPCAIRAALTEVQAGAGESTDDDCASCGERIPRDECPESKRPCGHHCNHSWTHDACDWCGAEFGEDDESTDSEAGR